MKLFHLSDLHIGLKLINRDFSGDQIYILDKVVELAAREKPDAVLIAGDIYDKAIPSAEAVDIFDYFISRLSEAVPEAEIMMISGNHDSASRLNLFRNLLHKQKIHMIGMPPRTPEEEICKVTLQDAFGPVVFYLLPFVKPSMVKEITGVDEKGNNLSYDETLRRLIGRESIDTGLRNVLVSHQFYLPAGEDPEKVDRSDAEIRTVGNIDQVNADVLSPFDYAALGHIHKPMKVGRENYRYCGTPMACSVSEAGQQKGIIMVELEEKGNVKTSVLPLLPLHQVRIVKGLLEDVLLEPSEDYVRVVLTDSKDLDILDMQDRLRHAFPNLLEIHREYGFKASRDVEYVPEKELDTLELCRAFLQGLDEDEEALLRDVINAVKGVQ